MPTKKTTQTKKTAKKASADIEVNTPKTFADKVKMKAEKIKQRRDNLLSRRPHRSFKRTRRRDYNRPLKLPGYWAFTLFVFRTLWKNKKVFLWLVVLYLVILVALIGIGSQEMYNQISDTLRSTSGDVLKGSWGEVGKAGLLVVTGITGGYNQTPDAVQQFEIVLIVLFTWLTTVWLLRAILAGNKPKLRDGLYNAGSPILPTFLVGFYLILQLLPVAIAAVGFSALVPYGILDGGIEAMLYWGVALLLAALSLYWITSTLIALVVITLPGMYPFQAIKTAGDLVIGRRLKVLLRILFMVFNVALVWAVIMVPIVLFDTWLKGVLPSIDWIPVVPFALSVMMTLTVVWVASYVYLFYRRVVEDDSAPA